MLKKMKMIMRKKKYQDLSPWEEWNLSNLYSFNLLLYRIFFSEMLLF